MVIYLCSKSDRLVGIDDLVNFDGCDEDRSTIAAALRALYRVGQLINVRRHIPVCPLCGQLASFSEGSQSKEIRQITASEIRIMNSQGVVFVVDALVLHAVDVHGLIPSLEVRNAIMDAVAALDREVKG